MSIIGFDPTRADESPQFPMGTKTTLGGTTYVYYKVLKDALYYAKGGVTLGRPGLIDEVQGGVLCSAPRTADLARFNRKMVLGNCTAAYNTYCWFIFEGRKVLLKHDKTKTAVGQKITAKVDISNTVLQGVNYSYKDLTITARVQAIVLTNSATNNSNTGDHIIWVDLLGA